jgi:uncharacterized protein YbjT (DUF2867 family)
MLLVTGATGNVGNAVLGELAGRSIAVRALTRDTAKLDKSDRNLASHVEIVQGDLTDSESVRAALQGVEAVFLASSFSPQMIVLHTKLLSAARAAGVKRIVQLSGIGANSEICCARALRWLGELEKLAQGSGLQVTCLRPTFFMQNLLEFGSSVAQQGLIAGPFRDIHWTWVDARDVGAVAAAALLDESHAGATYTVTGAESLTYAQVAERLGTALEKPVRYVDITANETRGRLQAAGMSPVMIEATLELWDACASNLINVAPNDVVQRVTGRAPRSLAQFARDYRQRFQ